MKIVYMGTPDYAVPTLEALINEGHSVEAVFCQPDKPVGRKKIMTPPAVKAFALSKGLKVYQPDSLKSDEVYELLKEIAPEVIVVVAYGKILPERILNIAPFGCVNGHGSILPKYRGAAPIQWAIINGETETGVTAMFMDKGIDTGDILKISKTKIGENETAEELFERLKVITARLLTETLREIESGNAIPIKQNEDEATYAPIINKEMALIDFSKPAESIFNAVRGFNSWPVAYCMLDGKRFKVFSCRVNGSSDLPYGTLVDSEKLRVVCGDGKCIELTEIQLEGSKRMMADEFIKGKKIPVGTVLIGGEQRG